MHDPAPPSALPRGRVVLGALLAWGLGLVAALGLVRAALQAVPAWTLEEEGVARIKLRQLALHGGEYDTLFLGSSRVYRQVDVALFDRELARQGVRARSYNLGLPGMRFFEVVARATALLERPDPAWRTLVLELSAPDPELNADNERSQRDLSWHTPAVTLLACRTVWDSPRGLVERLGLVRRHLSAGLLHASSAGQGLPALRGWLGRVEVPEDLSPGGFLPLELDASPATTDRRREFLAALTEDRRWMEKRWEALCAADGPPEERDLPPSAVRASLRGIVARAEAHRIRPVFVLLPPAQTRRREMLAARAGGILPNLIDLEAPRSFPDFHRKLSLRQDENHLNRTGAELLTIELARAFRELVGGRS